MSENESSRRKFLKSIGILAGAAMVNTNAYAGFVDPVAIRKLNAEQQEFMLRYGRWMDEFIEVIRVQKAEPDNMENQHRMIALTGRAEALNPELAKFMEDENFAVIYQASIKRMSDEIE